MTNWTLPSEIGRDSVAFNNFMHTLLGLYIWEWATSLDFDLSFVRGKRRFGWPMIFYFLGRYCLLFALIGIAIALNVTSKLNCQALYTFNQCFGNAAVGFASINLSIRTMAVWAQRWYIVVPLVVIILGHWSLLLHGILLKAAYFPGQGCVITQTSNKLLAISFIYTMIFDLIVLSLSAVKLAFPKAARSKLVNLVFGDGLIYFVLAFLANLIATVFMLLNLNAVMSIIANVPAAIVSTIAASRAVRRLSYYITPPEQPTGLARESTLHFGPGRNAQQPTTAFTVDGKQDPAVLSMDSDGYLRTIPTRPAPMPTNIHPLDTIDDTASITTFGREPTCVHGSHSDLGDGGEKDSSYLPV